MENAVHITWSNLVGILSHVQAAPSGTSLTVSGQVDGSSAAVFEELLLRVSRTHRPPLLLDLSRIDSMDGAGLAALLTIRNLTAARDRRLRIIAASTPVRTLLCLTGAQHILDEAPRAVRTPAYPA
jgi:anti-anti-sigma factor